LRRKGIWRQGVLPDYYLNKYNQYLYPDADRNEPDVRYVLPNLSKKIIYIDQFTLGYMVCAIHPGLTTTGNNEADG